MLVRLKLGDCVTRMSEMSDSSVQAVICDPPYDLVGQGARKGSPQPGDLGTPYGRSGPSNARGFMNALWDGTGIGFRPELWAVVLRILVPGGTVKAFGGTRTFHRQAAAMEKAGFMDVRLEAWAYSSGFPKSHDVGKAIDRMKGLDRQVVGVKRGVRGADGTGSEKEMPGKAVGVKQVACNVPVTTPASPEAELWDGWGTALKPAWEPVLVGRKPWS